MTRRWFTSKPEQETPAETVVNLRANLKQFLLKVHPDFFANDLEIQSANDKALKQLNQFLDVMEDALERSARSRGLVNLDKNKIPTKISIVFYIRHRPTAEDANIPNLFVRKSGDKYLMVRADYVFPREIVDQPVSARRIDRECRLYLNELLRQADLPELPVPNSERSPDGQGGETGELDADDDGMKPDDRAESVKWTADFKKMLDHMLNRHYPLEQYFLDSLGGGQRALKMAEFWGDTDSEVLKNLHHFRSPEQLQQKPLFFSPSLDGEQRGEAMLQVEKLIEHRLIPKDVPILITNDNTYLEPEQFPGFLTIPHNFKKEELVEYLERNLPLIRHQRRTVRELTNQAEFLQRQMMEVFHLASVEIRAGLEETVKCLRAFATHGGVLEEEKLVEHFDGLTIIIADGTGKVELDPVRDTLIIPVTRSGPDMVKDIRAQRKAFELRTKFNPHHTSYMTQFANLLKDLRDLIGARGIIVDMSIINSKKRQLEAAASIHAHAKALKKHNLSKIVIALADRYAVDFKRRIIFVPFNFNLKDFDEYLNDILSIKYQMNQ
jgi:hypothetical protein